MIVDFPGDKAEDAEVTNGLADATPGAATAAAKPPKSLATITRISQGKTNSVILSPKGKLFMFSIYREIRLFVRSIRYNSYLG